MYGLGLIGLIMTSMFRGEFFITLGIVDPGRRSLSLASHAPTRCKNIINAENKKYD